MTQTQYNIKKLVANYLINNKNKKKYIIILILLLTFISGYVKLLNNIADYSAQQAEQYKVISEQLIDLHARYK